MRAPPPPPLPRAEGDGNGKINNRNLTGFRCLQFCEFFFWDRTPDLERSRLYLSKFSNRLKKSSELVNLQAPENSEFWEIWTLITTILTWVLEFTIRSIPRLSSWETRVSNDTKYLMWRNVPRPSQCGRRHRNAQVSSAVRYKISGIPLVSGTNFQKNIFCHKSIQNNFT